MKRTYFGPCLAVLCAACIVDATAAETDSASSPGGNRHRGGTRPPKASVETPPVPAIDKAPALSEAEITDLLFLREEEKLARDVYRFLFQKHGIRTFSRISASEQNHMDSVKRLLDSHGLTDPAEGRGEGEFQNAELQTLYQTLIERGGTSPAEAIQVGILIEEKDIKDLEDAITRTGRADIKRVYSQLLKGSRNHLAAFRSQEGKRK